MRILKYPNALLRADNEAITVFDEQLSSTVSEMFKVMYASNGLGLSAPQVGINKRLMVLNESGDRKEVLKERVFINPRIMSRSKETCVRSEGCLSFPSIEAELERFQTVDVEFDCLPLGARGSASLSGIEAQIFQHEYDHLNGRLFIDLFDEWDTQEYARLLNYRRERYGPSGKA